MSNTLTELDLEELAAWLRRRGYAEGTVRAVLSKLQKLRRYEDPKAFAESRKSAKQRKGYRYALRLAYEFLEAKGG